MLVSLLMLLLIFSVWLNVKQSRLIKEYERLADVAIESLRDCITQCARARQEQERMRLDERIRTVRQVLRLDANNN